MIRYSILLAFAFLMLISLSCTTGLQGRFADIFKPSEKVVLKSKDNAEKVFPFAQAALDAAKEGDIVLLYPGLHRGPLKFKSSGVILQGKPGAFVNANSETWKPEWEKEPEFGPYAYSSSIPFRPITMTIDNRAMIDIVESKAGDNLKTVHTVGVGRNGRNPLRSLFSYLKSEKRVIVSFADNIDPSKYKIEASSEIAVILISGYDNCIVESLIVTGGKRGVQLEKTKNSIVRKCLIYGVDRGVLMYKGAESCKILSNDITWNADAMNGNCASEAGLPGNDVWIAHKKYGTSDKHGVYAICAGSNNEIAYNYIYDIWDGVQNGGEGGPAEVENYYKNKVFKGVAAEYNVGLKVHHNRIDLTMDDALEPGGALVDNQWYSNYVTRADCAARLKTVSMGPFYFFDNILMNSHDGMRFYKSTPKSATVYVYHNLIQFYYGICYHGVHLVCWNDPWLEKNLKRGTPGFHVFNNVFLCEKALKNTTGITPNYIADKNLYTCLEDEALTALGIDKNSLFNAKPQFINKEKGDWRLESGSPGKEFGKDLTQFKIKLPFCDKKYFKGKLPDMGPLGTDLAKVPHGPVSGLWQIAHKNIGLGERNPSDFKLEPVRWVNEKRCEFILSNLPAKDSLTIDLVRSPDKGKPEYTITAMNDKGKVIAQKKGRASSKVEFISLEIPLDGEKQIKLIAEDSASPARWRIDPRGKKLRVGINAAKSILLVKYDGGRYIFEYDVPEGTESFKIILGKAFRDECSAEIIDPGGVKVKLDKSGIVKTNGVYGIYRVLYKFTKKGRIKVEGPNTILYIDKKQETAPLIKKWSKPTI
jgi:hypothetical protein